MSPRLQEGHRNDDITAVKGLARQQRLEQRLVEIILGPFPALHRRGRDSARVAAEQRPNLVGEPLSHGIHGDRWRAVVHDRHLERVLLQPLCPAGIADEHRECARDAIVLRLRMIDEARADVQLQARARRFQSGRALVHALGKRFARPEEERNDGCARRASPCNCEQLILQHARRNAAQFCGRD
eukprot:7391426-Prymnesium_polylepis.2